MSAVAVPFIVTDLSAFMVNVTPLVVLVTAEFITIFLVVDLIFTLPVVLVIGA